MNITYQSISQLSLTTLDDKPDLELGCQIGNMSEGIQPTYGMTADDMSFHTFIMTVKWSEPRKNRMIPTSEIDDDIKSLMSAAKWGQND